MRLPMRLLERHIFFQLVRVFTVMLIVMTCLLVFVGAFGQMREKGLSPAQAIAILPYITGISEKAVRVALRDLWFSGLLEGDETAGYRLVKHQRQS